MILDLSDVSLFEENSIEFNKCTFIYGQNGSGKSTIANKLKSLNGKFDVRVFQGFESVLSSNQTLNAVVLGEKNNLIEQAIKEKEDRLLSEQKQFDSIKLTLVQPEDLNTVNFWTRKNDAEKEFLNLNNEIDKWYSTSASIIKKSYDNRIADYTYNKNNFKYDINKATLLSKGEEKSYLETLNIQRKVASDIVFPNYDLSEILCRVNDLISVVQKQPISLPRLDNDKKIKFAHSGLQIHKKGDVCAFCGNVIKDDVLDELERYFTSEDIQTYQERLIDAINKLDEIIDKIKSVKVNTENFYPEYVDQAEEIQKMIDVEIQQEIVFFEDLKKAIDEKNRNIFGTIKYLTLVIPNGFDSISNQYNILKTKNNSIEVQKKQNEAKEKLKLHQVKKLMNEYSYNAKMGRLEELERQKEKANVEFENANKEILPGGKYYDSLEKIKNEISDLRNQTVSETLLVENINKKLSHMVSFELHHERQEGANGIYNIKDKRSGKIRNVNQLSTGEKNIIAFLYFVEKIGEVKGREISKSKIIVFDDPMSSNDDGMQYIIMGELNRLIKRLDCNDYFIMLTHNKHFYINMKNNGNKEKKLIHLMPVNGITKITNINSIDEDFKTSYDSLWMQLKFLYKCDDANAELLLNPMRRILETYIKFNNIGIESFYNSAKSEAKKYFNVNSHSIDDLEAELNGKNKDQILDIFRSCFEANGAESHFNAHWKV